MIWKLWLVLYMNVSIFPKTYIKESRWRFAYHDCSHHPGATNTSLVAHVCVHTCALTHTPSSALKELRTLHNFSGLGLESRYLFCEHCQGRHCCEHPTGSIEWRPSLPRWQRNNGLTKRSVTRKVNFKDTIFRSFSKVHMGFHTLDRFLRIRAVPEVCAPAFREKGCWLLLTRIL